MRKVDTKGWKGRCIGVEMVNLKTHIKPLECFIMKETKLWVDSLMSYDCWRDFQTSLVIIGGRQSGIEKYPSYGRFEKIEVYVQGGQ
jgi:hypothetical protein